MSEQNIETPPGTVKADHARPAAAPNYARPLSPDRKAAESFLEFLDPSAFSCDAPFVFQIYDDGPKKRDGRMFIGTLGQLISTLAAENRNRFAVHVTINDTSGKRRRKENVVRVRSHFVEIDGAMTLPQIQNVAELVGLDVARINESSPGKFHIYFNIADDVQRDLTGFTLRQKKLAVLFKGGRESVDLARVLRLPGFWHQKSTPFQVRMVYSKPNPHAHTLAELEAAIGRIAIPDAAPAERAAAHDEDDAAVAAAIEHFKTYPEAISDTANGPLGKRGNSTTYDAMVIARDIGLSEATCLELAAEHYNPRCGPPWDLEELKAIVQHAYQYGQNPPGVKHPAAEFRADPLTDDEKAHIERDALRTYREREHRQRGNRTNASTARPGIGHNSGIVFLDADKIEAENLSFVWNERFARGTQTVIAGEGGGGKSQLMYKCMATITTADKWPDGQRAPKGWCIILSAEESPKTMIAPRLAAAGADMRFIKIVTAVRDKDGERKFNLQRDLDALKALCQQLAKTEVDGKTYPVVMIGIDPASSYMGGDLDAHHNTKVRHVLDPLTKLAEDVDCVVLSIAHFRKGTGNKAVHKVMDSVAFVNAPRSAFGVFTDDDDVDGGMVFVIIKTNVGRGPGELPGFKFKKEYADTGLKDHRDGKPIKAPRIVWGERTMTTGDQIARLENERGSPKLNEAKAFLTRVLANGPIAVSDLREDAEADGLAWDTVQRAKRTLGVVVTMIENKPGSPRQWGLPD